MYYNIRKTLGLNPRLTPNEMAKLSKMHEKEPDVEVEKDIVQNHWAIMYKTARLAGIIITISNIVTQSQGLLEHKSHNQFLLNSLYSINSAICLMCYIATFSSKVDLMLIYPAYVLTTVR